MASQGRNKKSGRTAAEGPDRCRLSKAFSAVVLKSKLETDFVARTRGFQELASLKSLWFHVEPYGSTDAVSALPFVHPLSRHTTRHRSIAISGET